MEAKIKLTQEKAATLYSLVHVMTGPVHFRAKREEVQQKLAKTWPEILESLPPAAENRKEVRVMVLNEREQKAMGEGLLSLVRKGEANGADYRNCLELAETLRIRGWFRQVTTVEEVPEFDGALDDEPAVSDPEEEEGMPPPEVHE